MASSPYIGFDAPGGSGGIPVYYPLPPDIERGGGSGDLQILMNLFFEPSECGFI